MESVKKRLQADAAQLRKIYLDKPVRKSNVAILELHLTNGTIIGTGATSKLKSPTPKPKKQSEGGQFQPTIDPYSGRIMDTDAEYKALSALAETLENVHPEIRQGIVYLYTEKRPCNSCLGIIKQLERKFPAIKIEVFWDYPYP